MATMTSLFADWTSTTTGYCVFDYDGSTLSVDLTVDQPGSYFSLVDVPSGYANIDGLSAGVTYTVTATAQPGGNTLSSSFTTPDDPPPPPDPPSNLTGLSATAGIRNVALTWSASSDTTSYTVSWSGATSGSTSVSGTNDIITGLTSGSLYTFTVTPVGPGGTGGSQSASATPTFARPNNFAWLYSTVTTGSPATIDYRDWNNLGASVDEFREYYFNFSTPFGFTTAVSGANFEAFYYRQAVNGINTMSPPTSTPPLHYSGEDIIASQLNLLVTSLNSIP